MLLQPVIEAAERRKASYLDELIEFLRIPSISTSPAHRSDMQRAADWLAERMKAVGLQHVQLLGSGGHPIVYSEWLEAGPQAPTLLIYGHYDVQPTDPDQAWLSPPFEPSLRDGYLYARGASDDKGQHYTHLAAVDAFLKTQGKLPVNVKFFIEGEEESGSPQLEHVIRNAAEQLRCDAVVISDGGFLNANTPRIDTGVRGLVYTEVEVRGPRRDLHSGSYGGAVHNPLQVMVELLAKLHDDQGRVAVPGFYDKVRPINNEERLALQRIPFDAEQFRREEVGAPALWSGEAGYSVLERIGCRPTLEIHGIRGGFVDEGQKTVIPAAALAKVSMRLVPDQDPLEIARLFAQHIHQLAPPTVQVQVRTLSYADPAVIDIHSPAVQAAVVAFRQGFGAEPIFARSGGTLPVVAYFVKILRAPVVFLSYGLPDDNWHAPNERFKLDHFYRGINTSIFFMHALATRVGTG